MAFGEHFIDFVNLLPPVARRRTRPERRFELWIFCGLAFYPPARQTPGLARQILERQLEGLEPPAEAFGVDKAIGRRSGIGYGRVRLPQGIIRVEMDAWGIPHGFSAVLAQLSEVLPRIEELEGGRPVSALPPFPMAPAGIGREIGRKAASFTTRPLAAMMIRRRTADLAGRSTRSTALWTERGSRPTVAFPASPSMAKRAATMPLSASLLRSMALAQSKST